MTELPHTRTRIVHWISTAVALAAVVGVSSLIQPPDATANPVPSASPSASAGPDASGAHYPVNCGTGAGARVDVGDKASADFDGDGRSETVAVARCHSEAGTPPDGLFVLADTGSSGSHSSRPKVAATLVPNKEGMTVQHLAVHGRTVSAKLFGYSSPRVPRCCPDRERSVKWVWEQGKFVLKAAPVPGGASSV